MKGKLAVLIERFIELLTPSQCLACGVDGELLCTTCEQHIGLGKHKLSNLENLQGTTVGAVYDGSTKELILQLKFYRLRAAARAAARLVVGALDISDRIELITAVPISPLRYRERGYNQAELVAREVARELNLPYLALLGRENSAHQMGQGRTERLRQIKGAFFALRQLNGQKVLIVDDVITTGATLSEGAGVLMAAGAGEVWGAVVARH